MKIIKVPSDGSEVLNGHGINMESIEDQDVSVIEVIINDDPQRFKDVFLEDNQCASPIKNRLSSLDHCFPQRVIRECHLAGSVYSPDAAWCLAAVYNSRKIMTFLHEESVMVTQANSHGNNMLHCLVAYASTMDEAVEEDAVATVVFIRELLDEDEYKQLLLSENEHELRPLELAAHLGAFVLYKYFLNTKGVYITREETFMWYTIQYYDVTEYMDRTRFVRSPPFLMMHLDQEKLCHKSVKDVYLGEPMKAWFQVIQNTNMPYVCFAAVVRFLFIGLFFGYLTLNYLISLFIECYYYQLSLSMDAAWALAICTNGATDENATAGNATGGNATGSIATGGNATGGNATGGNATGGNATASVDLLAFIRFSQYTLLVSSAIIILWDFGTLLQKTCFQPKWIHQKVTGRKKTVTNYNFYRVVQFLTLLSILSCTAADFYLTAADLKYFIAAAVITCVWNALYFLQLVPIFDIYVIAIQRMLKDFANFSLLFILFFIPYIFGFWILHFGTFDPYKSFLVMLNMEDFDQVDLTVKVMHLVYIFVMAILLLTYMVAMMSSTYEHVREHGELLRQLQSLSVTLVAQEYFSLIFRSLHTRLCKRHMVHEGGRFYITRVIMKPRKNPHLHNS